MLKNGKDKEREKVVELLSKYQLINLGQHFRSKLHFVNRFTGKSNESVVQNLNTFEIISKKRYFHSKKNTHNFS
jgi:hypothetical protein